MKALQSSAQTLTRHDVHKFLGYSFLLLPLEVEFAFFPLYAGLFAFVGFAAWYCGELSTLGLPFGFFAESLRTPRWAFTTVFMARRPDVWSMNPPKVGSLFLKSDIRELQRWEEKSLFA
ncbi:hypothetical protein B0H11DRAFT_2071605 [Mycena galericulata]|nr:hypothetical protein B0H11DRAFT_2071605 [Mycena galericulata]